ncbi:hypothetical protein FACS189487_06470 [Campylobacterota bacterium]|nr:hypothetical protein FACS189487_06470 [Campylobacterota bacterium]
MRIAPELFEMTRSFRRVFHKCERLRLMISRPIVDDARLNLYERYHIDRQTLRGWEYEQIGQFDYYEYFVDHAQDYGYEFAYYYYDRLAAVALVDLLPTGLSAVYCYYDPELKHLSLGTYSILRQILFAKEHGFAHLYLGYSVEGNASLSYKMRFHPREMLVGSYDLRDEPIWIKEPFDGESFATDTD